MQPKADKWKNGAHTYTDGAAPGVNQPGKGRTMSYLIEVRHLERKNNM